MYLVDMSTIDMSTNQQDPSATIEALSSLFKALRRRVNQSAAKAGLGMQQAILLRHLRSMSPVCQADMARTLGHDPAATAKSLDSLIHLGYVERQDDPQDRRRWKISLTPLGRAKAEEMYIMTCALSQELDVALAENRQAFLDQVARLTSTFQNPKP